MEEYTGTIKKFFPDRNFGFIKGKDKEIFFHISNVKEEFKNSITEGVKVKFKIKQEKRGIEAYDIKIIDNFSSKEKRSENFYCPRYLAELLENKKIIENFYLKLNKYPYSASKELKFKIDEIPGITNFPILIEIKNFINTYFTNIRNLKGYTIKEIEFIPEYKLIIGLGTPSIYEVSMTLHHIYGFPYIPGQAIKGVLRNYVINEYFDLSEDERNDLDDDKKIAERKEEKAIENPLFKFLFGTQKSEGNLIFFDSYPVGNIKIDVDLMNNHFPEYYEDDKNKMPPADYQNPRPIKFLTVKNTKFKFFICIKNYKRIPDNLEKFNIDERIKDKEQMLSYVVELLKEALEFNGIGAKTSIGYGFGIISG